MRMRIEKLLAAIQLLKRRRRDPNYQMRRAYKRVFSGVVGNLTLSSRYERTLSQFKRATKFMRNPGGFRDIQRNRGRSAAWMRDVIGDSEMQPL